MVRPEEEHVGEQRAGTAAGAQRHLGVGHLHGDALTAQLLHAAHHALEQDLTLKEAALELVKKVAF